MWSKSLAFSSLNKITAKSLSNTISNNMASITKNNENSVIILGSAVMAPFFLEIFNSNLNAFKNSVYAIVDEIPLSASNIINDEIKKLIYPRVRNLPAISILSLNKNFEIIKKKKTNNNNNNISSKAGSNWNFLNSSINISFYDNFKKKNNLFYKVEIPLSNTIFSTGLKNILFINENLNSNLIIDDNYEIDIKIPINNDCKFISKQYSPLKKLYSPFQEKLKLKHLIIQDTSSNLLKKISNKSASFWLQDAVEFYYKSLKNKNKNIITPTIFAIVKSPNSNLERRYKLIAGGGNWGPRSQMLVVDSQTINLSGAIKKGDIISFYILDQDLYSNSDKNISSIPEANINNLVFECLSMPDEIHSPENLLKQDINLGNFFGAASENPIISSNWKYDAPGEVHSIYIS